MFLFMKKIIYNMSYIINGKKLNYIFNIEKNNPLILVGAGLVCIILIIKSLFKNYNEKWVLAQPFELEKQFKLDYLFHLIWPISST